MVDYSDEEFYGKYVTYMCDRMCDTRPCYLTMQEGGDYGHNPPTLCPTDVDFDTNWKVVEVKHRKKGDPNNG
jgi:hypothetical protein